MHVEIGYGRMVPGKIGEGEIHRRLNFKSGSQTASSARRARMNAVPPAIRRAVGVSGSTTRQNGVTAWSPDSQALTAPAAMSRNNLWVVTGQVTSAPYRTAIDRRTALSASAPRQVGNRRRQQRLRRVKHALWNSLTFHRVKLVGDEW